MDNISCRTSQVNHAGDSTKQHTNQDTGVGSGVLFGFPVSNPQVVEIDGEWTVEFGTNALFTPESHVIHCKDGEDAFRVLALIYSVPANLWEYAKTTLYFEDIVCHADQRFHQALQSSASADASTEADAVPASHHNPTSET